MPILHPEDKPELHDATAEQPGKLHSGTPTAGAGGIINYLSFLGIFLAIVLGVAWFFAILPGTFWGLFATMIVVLILIWVAYLMFDRPNPTK